MHTCLAAPARLDMRQVWPAPCPGCKKSGSCGPDVTTSCIGECCSSAAFAVAATACICQSLAAVSVRRSQQVLHGCIGSCWFTAGAAGDKHLSCPVRACRRPQKRACPWWMKRQRHSWTSRCTGPGRTSCRQVRAVLSHLGREPRGHPCPQASQRDSRGNLQMRRVWCLMRCCPACAVPRSTG